MCGIIAYKGNKNASEIVVHGLKKLEYRGYDSWGIVVKQSDKFTLKKAVGKIGEANVTLPESNVAIAHTRWATHGKVTEANAHPHVSNSGKIAVVHNGIIENYQAQKKFLTEQGFKFQSETDTEVIPNTIEYHMRKGYDFIEACKHSLKHFEGQYAVAVMHVDSDQIIAIRKEAPLVIGIGEKEFFIASDIPAFLDYTKQVVFLEEKDLAIINDKLTIYNLLEDLPVKREVVSVDWSPEQAKKGDFKHFFMKEIAEQADIINRVASQDKSLIKDLAKEIKSAKGVYLVACGTAAHACRQGMYLFSKVAKTHVNFCVASEFPHFQHFLVPKSLVIAVSQSGETADTLAAIRTAKAVGTKVVSIVNVIGSSIARESDKAIMQRAGPEICVMSTKAFTSQVAILTLLAYELAGKLDEGIAKIRELARYIYYLTSENMREHIKQLAERLRYTDHIYLLGRGLQYPTALEAAHKIKEASYIHAEGFAAGELKHCELALIAYGTPCIFFVSSETEQETMSNVSEVKARGGYVIGVGPKNSELFDFFIKVREAEEANSICQIIPMQILAYQLAVLRGCDPDYPRNLAKAVCTK